MHTPNLPALIAFLFFIHEVHSNKYATQAASNAPPASSVTPHKSFDNRKTITRSQVKSIYNKFALSGHIGGNDASSGYGGPAVNALVALAKFGTPTETLDEAQDILLGQKLPTDDTNGKNVQRVLDYGCGQGKLAEHVFDTIPTTSTMKIHWHGIDQSPEMVTKFQQRLERFHVNDNIRTTSHLVTDGDPSQLHQRIPSNSYDIFISTYCLDLLSEEDMYSVLSLAHRCLRPEGKLLLAGITYGYRDSIRTFFMTLAWEIMYWIKPDVVGGCRPQHLRQYLEEKGWRITKVERTMPVGFPWMVSEVICAIPPLAPKDGSFKID